MENHRKKTSSGDIFSFSSSPSHEEESEFEFGCFTPDSPSNDPYKNSPADHIFNNGRLLPHSFPLQQQQTSSTMALVYSISRASSRTSSVSSKDSLVSSRSNSTNSSVSSARTSSSEINSDGRLLYHHSSKIPGKAPVASKAVMAQLYGSSQRWQHIMPVPAASKREDSRRKTRGIPAKEGLRRKKKQWEEGKKEKSSGLLRRIFNSLLLACRECHAMEPSTKKDHQLAENMKL